jgi:hypothetical protein
VLNPANPNDIDLALAKLRGPAQERMPAYNWFRDADPNHPRRAQAAREFEQMVDAEGKSPLSAQFFVAYFRWAGKENVPSLKRLAENPAFTPWDNERRQKAMVALGKMKEISAAEIIAAKLGNAFDGGAAMQALTEMGPGAEGVILKHFNHPDGRTRDQARILTTTYKTRNESILAQTIADLDSADANRRNAAVQWIANAPVEAKKRADVARALNKSVPSANFFFEKDLVKALETWGTSENVPALALRVHANQTGDRDAIRILGKIRDPNGLKEIAKSMSNFFNQGPGREALRDAGPAAEPAVIEAMFATADANLRRTYVSLLGEIGTRAVGVQALNTIVQRNPQDVQLRNAAQSAGQAINLRGK